MKDIKYEDNPESIKYYVKKYILENSAVFKGRKVLDLPAGSGITSRILSEVGAKVYPYDLFPEFFHETKIPCKFCDLTDQIPEADATFDIVICQEGIEHLPNPYFALREMNRVLKKNGLLIITTPNYSNLQSRLSHLIFESENYTKLMPPNEYESIWFSGNKNTTERYYFGHAFLLGIQKFRLLWKINGFELVEIVKNKIKMRNVFLLLFFYPLMAIRSYILLQKNLKEISPNMDLPKIQAFKEQMKLNLSPVILLHGHLFIVLKKNKSLSDSYKSYKNRKSELLKET